MGFLALAIRLMLWRALFGATYAGSNVFDSVVGAIEMAEERRSDTKLPVLTITTDEEVATVDGHNHQAADRTIEVVVEMAIFSAIKDKAGFTIAHTDDGLELALNYLGRQVMRILQVDDGNPWGDLFRRFCMVTKVEAKRAANVEKGERIAARQVIITVKATCGEPPFGVAPAGLWADLVAVMRDDELLADLADGLVAEITGVAIPDWAQTQARTGLARDTMNALGLGPLLVAPLVYDGEGEAPDPAPAEIEIFTSDGDHLAFTIEIEP